MGFSTDGFVLRAPRTAPANAKSTGSAINGVSRDHKPLPGSWTYFDSPDDLLEVPADMYRTAVLDNPNGDAEEYLVWAANSSSFALLETDDFLETATDAEAMVSIPRGTIDVDISIPLVPDATDGTDRLIVVDPEGRGLASIKLIIITRGDNGVEVQCGPNSIPSVDFASQDPTAGLVELDASTLSDLGGGVSSRRGDTITQCDFIVAAARFWWTKNDRNLSRFGWNGRTQRWEPYKGKPPRNLELLTEDGEYVLFPRPSRFDVGDNLPGDTTDSDVFALVRVGILPDKNTVVPEVQVVSDATIENGSIDFSGLGDPDAVVGQGNGIVIWNTTFIDANAGLTVWYTPEQYEDDANGAVGDMKEALLEPLFITPVPNATDRPFIRLGFRRPLVPIAKATDNDLDDQSIVPTGTVQWSMTTGRLALSEADLTKADPGLVASINPDFDKQYLGNQVYFDGVAMTTQPLRTPDPVHLVDDGGAEVGVPTSGKMYVKEAVPLPFPGTSGIKFVPDSTGQAPDVAVTPGTRENDSGLVRKVVGIGDTMVFTTSKAFDETEVVEFKKELNDFPFAMRKTKVQIAREIESGDPGSAVQFKRAGIKDEPIYFLQAEVMPAVYADDGIIYSREMGPFTFEGGEVLYFAIDGDKFTWTASVGTFSATDVASDILTSSGAPAGTVYAARDRIVLESEFPTTTGKVEIGFGTTTALSNRDFSAGTILGFLPGWVADATASENWLPDNGVAIGVSRSPLNKGRSNGTPDIRSTARFNNVLFANALIANPTFAVNNPPIQDIAGFDENVFFIAVDGLNFNRLDNLSDVLYDFGNDRFFWLEQNSISSRVEMPSGSLPLGKGGVVGLAMHPAVQTGFGFRLAEDGATWVEQDEGIDYLLPNDGLLGVALPIAVVGALVVQGAKGIFALGGFTLIDGNALFVTHGIVAGMRLHIISGDAEGSYIVASVINETTLTIESDVPFAGDAGPVNSAPYASWRIHEGIELGTYNPGVIADVVYEQFNHLATEPFTIELLDELGAMPTDPTAQTASRLVAVVSDAFTRGRTIAIQVGLTLPSPVRLSLSPLVRGLQLGKLAAGLYIPDFGIDDHYTTEKFSIRVGSKSYTIGVDLTVVAIFGPLTGDEVEVQSSTGLIGFGATTLSELAESEVIVDQEFLDPATLVAGEAEYNPVDGELNFETADMTTYGGETAYFVEKMISENQLDVVSSPVLGSFFFNKSLRPRQLVLVNYFQADSQGELASPDAITEYLPLVVRLEEATEVNSTTFTVNPTGRTIAEIIEPMIWAGTELQNFGNTITATFQDGTVSFVEAQEAGTVVQVNYGVYEAFGGEQAYNTSTTPVYRPPFFLEAEQDTFVLETDRTDDMVPGKLLRIGPQPYYIKSASYNVATDGTTVTVWPPQEVEAGSRAPGNDVLALLSSGPVTDEVDGTAIPNSFDLGFLLPLTVSYEAVAKGNNDIVFQGDLTTVDVGGSPVRITAGHLLEMDGHPFIVVAVELASDGRTTRMSVSSPALRSFNPLVDTVKLSVRPIYQSDPTEFLGIAPLVATEDYELVLFGEFDSTGTALPGRVLIPTIDYQPDPETGAILFLAPIQGPFKAGQVLLFSYTRLKTLKPLVQDGALVYPRFAAGYSYLSAPSEDNGLIGSTLIGTYTFNSPDTFYYRTTPLEAYMGEVAQLAVSRVAAQSPAGGPMVVSGGSMDNYTQGRLGFAAERRDLTDNDRAARTFIRLYNAVVVAFEQVLETVNGAVIGDRDGKFKFFVGQGKTYAPAGYEDEITGDLNNRFVWSQVFRAANGDFGVTEEDPVVDPETATIPDATTMEVDGKPMDPYFLRFYIDEQKSYVRNDMDDRVLVDQRRPFFGFGIFRVRGQFNYMWEASRISRLFPESTLAFSTTFPGLEADLDASPVDPGTYAFLKVLNPPKLQKSEDGEDSPLLGSTFLKAIGVVSNPALGVIKGISDIDTRQRHPRARIWAYSPDGFPEIDSATDGFATIIATPTFIKDFPIDPDTGFPDFDRLLTNDTPDSDTIDCGTGDPEYSTPPFVGVDADAKPKVLQQVSFGRPSGQTMQAGNAQQTLKTLFGGGKDIDPIYGGVFVGDVLQGCLIILADDKGDFLAGSDVLATGTSSLSGNPIELNQGDTIFVSVPLPDTTDFADPPTVEEMEEISNAIPTLDVGAKRKRGLWMDVSLPSWKDPFIGLKEMTNQNPPLPLATIEADVDFSNNNREPTNLPCLQGLPTNDSGDFGIPYLSFGNTELDRLGDVASAFTVVGQADAPGNTQAVYPDEIILTDGAILEVSGGPGAPAAVLNTAFDLTPVTTATFYTPNSGIGDVKPFDIMLIEVPNATAGLPAGATGVLEVAAVTSTTLEIPRFVTQSFVGDLAKYTYTNAMAHVASSPATIGITVARVGATTTFTINSPSPLLNDGSGPLAITGGLNNIFAAGNAVVIRLYENIDAGTPGTLVEEIVFSSAQAAGGAAGGIAVLGLVANEEVITVTTVVGLPGDFAANLGTLYDFTVTIDTYINTTTRDLITALGGTPVLAGSGTGSTTGWVNPDRLTFSERYDMTTAPERGALLSDLTTDISAGLEVWAVTASGIACSVNDPSSINGSLPLTFLSPDGNGVIGTFAIATGLGTEIGTVKAMSWEADNIPLGPMAGIKLSAVPSSDEFEGGTICTGTATTHDAEASIVSLSVSPANVVAGDICSIEASSTGDAAVSAGTYLVRHAIDDLPVVSGYREVALSGNSGAGGQFFDGVLPTIESFVGGGTRTVTVSGLGIGPVASTNGTQWDDDTSGGNPFGASTMDRLYVLVNSADPTSVVSKAITNIDVGTNTFTLASGSALTADGTTTITNAAFFNLLQTGMKVSGMRFLPIGTSGSKLGSGLPKNSTVGFDHGTTTYGFLHMVMSNTGLVGDVSTVNNTFTVAELTDGGVAGASEALGIIAADVADNKAFQTNKDAVVYPEVAGWFDLNGLPTSGGATRDWEKVHGDTSIYGITLDGVKCLLPSDRFVAGDTVDTKGNFDTSGIIGFQAEAGVFFEPSWPNPTSPINQVEAHVVDALRTAGSNAQIGMRDPSTYLAGTSEGVSFTVKRVRRWHAQLDAISDNLEPLRFAYETRRGVVGSYTASSRVLVASTPTQLGDFANIDVNVKPGDDIRLVDAAGIVLDTAEIASITDGTTLKLRKPGFVDYIPSAGDLYEIYLGQAPVPHEQSNEQLLELITDAVLFTSAPVYSSGAGGFVDAPNEMSDTTVPDWNALGLRAGDIILVDPAGDLEGPSGVASTPETGSRPFGDESVPDRGPVAPYQPGQPAELDDNRGFYRVVSIDPGGAFVTVTGASDFTGTDGSDVIFGSTNGAAGTKYAVMPTISGSSTPTSGAGATEGQQDLRITKVATANLNNGSDPNSFAGNQFSVAPFGYRIIRPSSLFSTEAIDLVLFTRERMLSWLEEMKAPMSGGKSGNYYVFQRDEHIANLGSPTNPDEGLGVVSNDFITSIAGDTTTAPFANVSDCLSVLDRRFWVLDYRLDSLTAPFGGSTPYSTFADGEGRPVLPDLVSGVLDLEDRFRQLRFAWLKFRSDRVNGTLPSIVRFDDELPRRQQEQEDLLRLQEGLDET
jgi:hypothetical protein